MSRAQGLEAELFARDYLINQGLAFVCNNFYSKYGEIDLVMQDQQLLVFVEVRARKSNAFGGGLASVTRDKQRKIAKAASWYLLKHGLQNQCMIRFDVVSLEGKPPVVSWVKDAFYG